METATEHLAGIIAVFAEGCDFYADAARRIEHTPTRELFERVAHTKRAIAAELRARTAPGGARADDSRTSRAYAELRARTCRDPEAEYFKRLEQCEDRVVHAFQDVIFDSDDADVRAVVLKYLPAVARDRGDLAALCG